MISKRKIFRDAVLINLIFWAIAFGVYKFLFHG